MSVALSTKRSAAEAAPTIRNEARPVGSKMWIVFLIIGAVDAFVYLLWPRGGLVQVFWYQAFPIAGFIAILVGVRRNKPSRPLAWYLIAAGQFAWVVGDAIWYVGRTAGHLNLGFPNVADGFYLVAYPFLAAGLVLYTRATAKKQSGVVIEATVVTIGLGLVSWVFFMAPIAHQTGMTFGARAVSLGYPLMDVLLIGVLVRLLFSRRSNVVVSRLLVASFLATLAADTAQLVVLLKGAYTIGGPIDPFWALGYLFLGAAALHPANAEKTPLPEKAPVELSHSRVALLTAGALLAPAALVMQQALHRPIDVALFAGASGAIFVLAILRISGLARSLQRMHAERTSLLRKVLRAGEEERMNIAGALHDGPIQRLAALRFRLEAPIRNLSNGDIEAAAEALRPIGPQLSGEVTGLRSLMTSLRPPVLDESGFVSAIEDLISAFERESGITAELHGAVGGTVPAAKAMVLYRVAQEGLRNVRLHAHASRVVARLSESDDEVILTIEDDGDGFDPASTSGDEQHFGLIAMRERVETAGGRWSIEAKPGQGTSLRAVLPIAESSAA